MSTRVKEENIGTFYNYQSGSGQALIWPSVFVLPAFLQTWWEAFGEGYEPFLQSIWNDRDLIGLAPLLRKGTEARLVGSADVCDYLDFIYASDQENEFFQALLPFLQEQGIKRLELQAQRPDAAVFKGLFAAQSPLVFEGFGVQISLTREDETYEVKLPSTWEDYLANLNKKQRHEIRRKIRRLERENAQYHFRLIEDSQAVEDFIPRFFELFEQNPEKADFLNTKMKRFFNALIVNLARAGLARFGVLEIEGVNTAAILYFDYGGRIYLYNSGYKAEYANLSIGLLSKIFGLKYNLEKGSCVFDFLKGREVYKSRLGGTALPIYNVVVEIK